MRYALVSCATLFLLTACGGGAKTAERPAALVAAQPVGTAQFADVIEAVGTALANEQVILASPVTERISTLNFTDGGFVAKGQVIATLVQGQQTAELAAAQARAQEAGQQLQRINALKDRGFATNANLDTQVAAQKAALATADQARASIADRVVRAPFSGYLGLRTLSPGAIVTAGTPIATVSDISRIKLDFTVPETRLAAIAVGQPIAAIAAAFPDRPFHGTIATIDPVIDPTTRAVRVRALLPNPDKALRPGMLLTVKVLAQQRQALAIPELAVIGDGEDRFVFVAQAGKAKRVKVLTGAREAGRVEILAGLTRGQAVVTEGVVKLSDGVPIRLAGDDKAGTGTGTGAGAMSAALAH